VSGSTLSREMRNQEAERAGANREAPDELLGVYAGVPTAATDCITRTTIKDAGQRHFAVRCHWPRRRDTPLTNPSFIGLIAGKH
jgi:hypothetical protein